MGMFVVAEGDVSNAVVDGTLSGAFAAPVVRTACDRTVSVFGTLAGSAPVMRDHPDGDFIAQSGIFYFAGQHGSRALDALFARFDGTHFPWAECRGHFALVIRWRRRLFVATDALGTVKLYHDRAQRIFSTSFVAVQARLPRVTIDPQGCYEYAWNGTTFGVRTFLDEIRMLRTGTLLELTARPAVIDEWRAAPARPRSPASFEALAQDCAARLRASFAVYAHDQARFRLALSGGYDSRLLLALLVDAGVTPALFVYGRPGGVDVELARAVAGAEGLPIQHIDKSEHVAAPDDPAPLRRSHDCLDGWNEYGVFDPGTDATDRLARAADGRILLNGSVGEIYRNFFNLPDRRYRLREVFASFYGNFAPHACTAAFDKHAYRAAMMTDMQQALGAGGDWLTREQVEALYPLHRGRYWTARDAAVNNRIGAALFPYLEPAIIEGTESIPVAFKAYGRFQARLIELVRPSLARVLSTRGSCPADDVPWRYKLTSQLRIHRPIWLRPYSHRLRHALPAPRPDHLAPSALARVIDPSLPAMRAYFHPERIHDRHVWNRICTMEWLSQHPVRAAAARR